MKKKIKDLTKEERIKICEKYSSCDTCPFKDGDFCFLQSDSYMEVEVDE